MTAMKNSPISNTVRNVLYIYLWRLMPRRRVKAYYRANAIVIAKATVDAPDSMRIAILENVLPVVPKFCRYDFLRIFEFVVICQDNGYTL
jgi:hypothetical protein